MQWGSFQYKLRSAKYCSCSKVIPMFLPSHRFSPKNVRCSMHLGSWFFPSMALFARIFCAGCMAFLQVQLHESLCRNVRNKVLTSYLSRFFASSVEVGMGRFCPLCAVGWLVQSTPRKGITLAAFLLNLFKAIWVNLRCPA